METHIERTGRLKISQSEWIDNLNTRFERKHVHSLHSLGAENRPILMPIQQKSACGYGPQYSTNYKVVDLFVKSIDLPTLCK